ncbi:unnamed protein product, partial [Rotaria socialis]
MATSSSGDTTADSPSTVRPV